MEKIGVFDSGVGGLSVLAAIREHLPAAKLVYVADTTHVPYGPRPLAEVRGFALGITRFLLDGGAQAVVVACNTASAAALHELRAAFPNTPFVGMEPAVKPAAEHSHTGVVAVLATPATFQGALFASVVERFAHGVEVIPQVCQGLVEQIEAGELDTPKTETMLRGWVEPLLARNIDALVLGCTHYPFVRPLLERICGPRVHVIDPSAAVARQVGRVLSVASAGSGSGFGEEASPGRNHLRGRSETYYTTGPVERLQVALGRLGFGQGPVLGAAWQGNQLLAKDPTAQFPAQTAG